MSGIFPSIPEQAIAALKRGDKIESVALTRMTLGIQLSEAEDAVDAYLKANPQTMDRAVSERSTGGGIIALLVLGMAVFFAYLLLGRVF